MIAVSFLTLVNSRKCTTFDVACQTHTETQGSKREQRGSGGNWRPGGNRQVQQTDSKSHAGAQRRMQEAASTSRHSICRGMSTLLIGGFSLSFRDDLLTAALLDRHHVKLKPNVLHWLRPGRSMLQDRKTWTPSHSDHPFFSAT
jgi:hypothetical protein